MDRLRRLTYPELCIAGSNTILGDGLALAHEWSDAFEASHNVRVRIEGVGSVRGVENAIHGECVHVLAMSEPMTDTQYIGLTTNGVTLQCAAEIGFDVIAFVTHSTNPLAALNARDLRGILVGATRNWDEVGGADLPIRIYARPGSGTTDIVLQKAARYRDANIFDDQYFPPNSGYMSCESNGDCLNQTLSTPGSLYWVSTAWMRTQPEEYIRVLPILQGDERAIDPLREDVDLNEYFTPMIRPLYFYVVNTQGMSAETAALARQFLTYVRSVQGQEILEKYHFYTFFNPPRELTIELPPGFEPDASGLRPVCVGA
ncbi:MAG: substrate-binding domain-containing protein [Anaerolineae bacterium]|nr:substrate-binding domain-containing protein [Anaerolineae bacterium]NUQ04942.1 substrate-binding domain-containing protein [Anaerolineae bacterium]